MKLLIILALTISAYSSDCVYYGTRITKTINEYHKARTNNLKEEKLGLLKLYISDTKSNCRKDSKYYKRAVKASRDFRGK